MNGVQQPRTLLVLGLNAWMSTAAGADKLVEIPSQKILTRYHPFGDARAEGSADCVFYNTYRTCLV